MLLKPLTLIFLLVFVEFLAPDRSFSTKLRSSARDFSENYLPEKKRREQIVRHTAYSLCYDNRYEQARWVAYRLNAGVMLTGAVERSNNFKQDPDVRSGSALPSDYTHSGYDRGHLCPAADMAFSSDAMKESFLMSNMSPQRPAFNRGIWKRLEEKVRDWALRDREIIVVSAGVLTDSLETIGESHVAVPRYFYKVIMDHQEPQFKAIAFIMPNEGSTQSLFHFAVSVDSVEKLTGINFFPALPDTEEDLLEASCDTLAWK